MSARDIGNAVRKPINIVRFLSYSAPVDVKAVVAYSHGSRDILAWIWDLLRDVDGAIGATVSISFAALSKFSSGWGRWPTEHCQLPSSTLRHHSSHLSQDLTW